MCHPYFVYAKNTESVYQYMFDNEMIDFDYEGVDKNSYTIKDIYAIFKQTEEDPKRSYRSLIVEVPTETVVPDQDIRWHKRSSNPVVVDFEDLEYSRQKELDLTVRYVRNLELKKNAFERLKELKDIDERLNKFTSKRRSEN